MKAFRFFSDMLKMSKTTGSDLSRLTYVITISELLYLPTFFVLEWFIGEIKAGEATLNIFIWYAAITVSIELVYGFVNVIRSRMGRRLALDTANKMRGNFLKHIINMPYTFFLSKQAGGQANSYMNDIDDIDLAMSKLMDTGLRSAIVLVVYIIALSFWNYSMAIMAIVFLPIMAFIQRKLRSKVAKSSKEKVELRESLTASLSESTRNIQTVKSECLEQHRYDDVEKLSNEFARADIVMETTQSILRSSASITLIFGQYLFFTFGAWLISGGNLSIASFIGQLWLIGKMTMPLNDLLEYANQLVSSNAALHRVQAVMDLPEEGRESRVEDLDLSNKGSAIEVKDLTFNYGEIPLFEKLSFSIREGETVAIVGESGSGKTTLFNLLLGLYDDYKGEIIINDKELKTVKLESLRETIGVVFQEQSLLNGTIRENLALGSKEPVSDEKLWQILEAARADEFVKESLEGLDSIVGMNGLQLSGGQRQRLAIARVMLKSPSLLLLDEATSALDSVSENKIQEAFDELFKGRTSIIAAHRLSTIVHVDTIIVFGKGKVVEKGSHKELLEKDGVYKKLFDAQVEGFLS